MKAVRQWRLAAALAAIAFCGCTGQVAYDDTDRRVDSLLKLMTLDEKIGQMSQFSCNWDVTGAIMPDDYREYLRKGMVGSILNGYTVAGIRQLQSEALEHSRLKIPVLFGYDVVHGYRTIFPIPLGESCTCRTRREVRHQSTCAGIRYPRAHPDRICDRGVARAFPRDRRPD